MVTKLDSQVRLCYNPTTMSYYPPPPPPEEQDPLTAEELASHDEIWERHDKRMIGIYQMKLAALGYESDLDTAKSVYESGAKSQAINKEYSELKSQHLINEMIAGIESIHRRLLG
jgi:hypothetical protein